MFFYKENVSYHIKTKTDKIEKLDDIEFKAKINFEKNIKNS